MELKETIFIIDDDPIQQRIAQIIISKYNLFDTCFGFTEAQKALDFIQENINQEELLPDTIILDLNMPLVDGWDFLNSFEILVKNLRKRIKLFIVSSSVDEKDRIRSKSYPVVQGFISKPLSAEIIRSIK